MINSFWSMAVFSTTSLSYWLLFIINLFKWHGENRTINEVLLSLNLVLVFVVCTTVTECMSVRSGLVTLRTLFKCDGDNRNVEEVSGHIRTLNWAILYFSVIWLILLMQLVDTLSRFR